MNDDIDTTDDAQHDDHRGARTSDDAGFGTTGGSSRGANTRGSADVTGLLADEELDGVLPKLYWIGLGLCGLVGLATLERFYAHATEAIARLVTPEYVDLFLAGFNLALLLLAGLAASYLVRQLVGVGEAT